MKVFLSPGRCVKLTRANSEAGYGSHAPASDLWAWLQDNESITVNAKQSGYVTVVVVTPPQ